MKALPSLQKFNEVAWNANIDPLLISCMTIGNLFNLLDSVSSSLSRKWSINTYLAEWWEDEAYTVHTAQCSTLGSCTMHEFYLPFKCGPQT